MFAPRGDARGGDMGEGGHGSKDPQAGTPYAISVNPGWRLPLTGLLASLRAWVMVLAVVVTVVTGLDYVVRAVALRRSSERTAMKQERRRAQGLG